MNSRLRPPAFGSASAKTCSGGMLCGLQSSVASLSCKGCVDGSRPSGPMSPRAQKFGVHALAWQVLPVSGSVCGGTDIGAAQVAPTSADVEPGWSMPLGSCEPAGSCEQLNASASD